MLRNRCLLNVQRRHRPSLALNTQTLFTEAEMTQHKLDASDIIYFPATYLLAYFVSKWLPVVVAVPVAVMVILCVGYFITRVRGSDTKSFLLAVLVAGIITFL